MKGARNHKDEEGPTRMVLWPNMDLLSHDRLLWLVPVESSYDISLVIRNAVTQLSERQREIVEGYFFEGVSQPELARRLGISQQVIHKSLYGTRRNGRSVGGALKKLRGILTPLLQYENL